ncbi:MAG TPA: cation diffusion facilitator family transporter [Alphaproteobacteria bacterium]|nr:cation diffusion facilitator family transporter [Alphaproteobacteria bacterium]
MTARALSAEEGARLRRLATAASVSVAALLIAVKLAAWIMTDAVSLLSSLIDSSVDLMASVVTLLGVRTALKPPDRSHRYGHGKAEPLAALVQAAFILGTGVILAYEALRRLFEPQLPTEPLTGIAVMAFSIVVTLALVAFQRHVVRRTASLAIGADSLHYRGDALMNAAVIAALALTAWSGWPYFDPIFGLGIAAFLAHGARRIALDALDVLMDRELPRDDRERIRAIVLAHPGAQGLHDLRTRHGGTGAFIELHLELDGAQTLADAHHITDEIEQRLRAAFPGAEIMLHQEPHGLVDERLDHRLG